MSVVFKKYNQFISHAIKILNLGPDPEPFKIAIFWEFQGHVTWINFFNFFEKSNVRDSTNLRLWILVKKK